MDEVSALDRRVHHYLVFMSDGCGKFDTPNVLTSIKNSHGARLSSYFIGFGSGDFPQLRYAATELRGTFSNSVDDVELSNAYAEIMQRIEARTADEILALPSS